LLLLSADVFAAAGIPAVAGVLAAAKFLLLLAFLLGYCKILFFNCDEKNIP
jgi:hypothetical protein